jgi:hypothetical protein
MGSDTSKSKKRATQLTEDEIQLLLKNTHFNRQQIKEWHQGFLVSEIKFRFILYLIKQSIHQSFCFFYSKERRLRKFSFPFFCNRFSYFQIEQKKNTHR